MFVWPFVLFMPTWNPLPSHSAESFNLQNFQPVSVFQRQSVSANPKNSTCVQETTSSKTSDSLNKSLQSAQEDIGFAQRLGNPMLEAAGFLSLGNAYKELNQIPQAIDAYQKAIETAKSVNNLEFQGHPLFQMGELYHRQCQYDKAITFYQQSATLHQTNGDRSSSAYAYAQLGLAQLDAHQASQAAQSLEKAVENFESIRLGLPDRFKISVFQMQSMAYRMLQKALILDNKPNVALEIAERGRARAFVELLGKRVQGVPKLEAPKLAQIQQIAKTQQATLVEYSLINDLNAATESGSARSTLLIWVIQPTGKVTLRQADLSKLPFPLAKVVLETRNSLFKAISDNPNSHLQQLHQLLIQPISDLLPKDPNARIIFVPQESLFLVPFAALQDTSGRYLIEQHTILMTPSIQVLDLTHQQKQRLNGKGILVAGFPRDGLIVGNPSFDPTAGPPLEAAEKEANAIAMLLKTQALTGSKATKAEILAKIPTAQMIHLATHGLYKDEKGEGLQSALAFAPGNQKDGFIRASEIMNLKLNASLAVLSACDTGRGEITGDGVIGLSRAFIGAGVPSLVVSLWRVNSDSTTDLMVQFYQNLLKSSDRAQALRQAMLFTLKKYDSPKDWAAFLLIGEAL
jgi:CHAT domain-containing protein